MLPQHHIAPPPLPPAGRRDPSSGAVKPLGVLAAMLTAGAVFGLGLLVLPSVEPDAPAVAPAPPPPPPPPAPPPPPEAPAIEAGAPPGTGLDAASAPSIQNPPIPSPKPVADTTPTKAKPEAKLSAEPASKPVAATPASKPVAATPASKPVAATKPAGEAAAEPATKPASEPAAKPVAEPATKPTAEAAAEPATKPTAKPTTEPSHDKDVARDAWRKNLPDISPDSGKTAMLIPIKGSIEGATYHVTLKPKSVLITLPKAESMITMPFYSVRHDGFRQLWIKKEETSGSTTIRVVLGEGSDPQVEIKDDFVRVTVRRPAPVSAPAAPGAPASAAATPTPPPAPAEAPARPGPAPGGD